MKFKSYVTRLYNFLITLQSSTDSSKINGGFYEEYYKSLFGWKKRMRLNSWTTMFALQGINWLENYDSITFEKFINSIALQSSL